MNDIPVKRFGFATQVAKSNFHENDFKRPRGHSGCRHSPLSGYYLDTHRREESFTIDLGRKSQQVHTK